MSEDDERERARLEKLHDIAFRSRAGEVEGVAFDLTFRPDFKWSDWEKVGAMGWLDWTGARLSMERPYIIWPWSEPPDDLNETDLRRALESAMLPNCAPDPDEFEVMVMDNIAARTPDIEVGAGDRVSIGRVTLNIREHYLQAPEDVDTLHAFLTVHRANGEATEIAEPLKYRRVGHLNVPSEHLPVQMENRAAARANVTSEIEIDDITNSWLFEGRELTLAQNAFLSIHFSNNDLTRLLEQMRDCLPVGEETERLVLAVRRIAGNFAAAGYDLAQTESEEYVVPLAERALASKAGTDAGAAAKRKEGEPVRETARAYIAKNPGTSQTACVAYVAAKLGKDESSVRRAIAPLFDWVDLHGGAREKRPIPGA